MNIAQIRFSQLTNGLKNKQKKINQDLYLLKARNIQILALNKERHASLETN